MTATDQAPPKRTDDVSANHSALPDGTSQQSVNGSQPPHKMTPLLVLAALGVVFGDIGTSPLYAFKLIFVNDLHSIPLNDTNVLGVLSLFFWSIFMVVTVKYVIFIMRFNNRGEGGIIALTALMLSKLPDGSWQKAVLIPLGMLGAAFFYGDGVITPAISVLSAVEGLELLSPHLKDYVVPVTLAILIPLFLFQKQGTDRIGVFFGPIMLVWFTVIAVLGVAGILQNPDVMKALSPTYALMFAFDHGALSFFALGSVVLCITGAEALYADMGHFGAKPIRVAWLFLVFPALILNYFGQGALVMADAKALDSPFFLLAPDWALTVLVIMATVATVVASQAVITGTFSMTQQMIQLRFMPRMRIVHTSIKTVGQIYVPTVNFMLMIMVILLVLLFKSSEALGAAYGIAVTGTMLITDIFAIAIAVYVAKWSIWRALLGASFFIVIDLVFFSANALKFLDGGWVPIGLSALIFIILLTWRRGVRAIIETETANSEPLRPFVSQQLPNVLRVPGSAVFTTSNIHYAPQTMVRAIKSMGVLHEQVVCVHIKMREIPMVETDQRFEVADLGFGVTEVSLFFGFREDVDLPRALKLAMGQRFMADEAIYFLNRQLFEIEPDGLWAKWRKVLFVFLFRNAYPISSYAQMPTDRVIEYGERMVI
jgi:KUP system potassium uptake protein